MSGGSASGVKQHSVLHLLYFVAILGITRFFLIIIGTFLHVQNKMTYYKSRVHANFSKSISYEYIGNIWKQSLNKLIVLRVQTFVG